MSFKMMVQIQQEAATPYRSFEVLGGFKNYTFGSTQFI